MQCVFCFGEEVELTELREVFLCVDKNKGNCRLRHVCPLGASELTSLFSVSISPSTYLSLCLSVSLVFLQSLVVLSSPSLFFLLYQCSLLSDVA